MKKFFARMAIIIFVCIFGIDTLYGMDKGKKAPPSPDFWKALLANQTQNVINLYKLGNFDLNVVNTEYTSESPLMYAVYHGNIQLVQYFLDNGANVNFVSPTGFTALMKVAPWGQKDTNIPIMQLLLGKGANPSAVAHNGFTALKMAAGCDSRLVPLLLKAGANSSSKNGALIHVLSNDDKPNLVALLADGTEYSINMLNYAARCGTEKNKKILTIAAQKNVARNVWEKLQAQSLGTSDIQAIVNKQFGKS